MLDILISYINFLFLSLKYICKKICFRPPNPKGYRIINENEQRTEILRKIKPKIIYEEIKFQNADFIYRIIPNEGNNIPIFQFIPNTKKKDV